MAVRGFAALPGSFLGYLGIFGASLAGYAGIGPWAIAVAAIGLASVSRGPIFGDL